MADYKELYSLYEEREDLHPEITETATAESVLADFLRGLDMKMRLDIDEIAGRLARAYEMRGFLFGLNFCRDNG